MSKLSLIENELSLSPSAWKFVFGLLSKKQIEEVTRLDPRKWENLSKNSELWMALYGAAFREHTQNTHLSVDRTTLHAIGSHQFTLQPSLSSDADSEIVEQLQQYQKTALRKFSQSQQQTTPDSSAWFALFGWEWNRMLHLYTHENKVVDFEYPPSETPLLTLHLDFEHRFHPSTKNDSNSELEDELELSVDLRKKTSVSLSEYTILERLFRNGLGLTLQYETDAGTTESKKAQKRVVVTEVTINAAGKPLTTNSSSSSTELEIVPRLEINFSSQSTQPLEIRLENDAFLLHHPSVMDIAVLLTENGLPHAERRLRYNGRAGNIQFANFTDAQLLQPMPTVRHEMGQSQPNQLISDILLVEDHHRMQGNRTKAVKSNSKTMISGATHNSSMKASSSHSSTVVLEKTVYERENPSSSTNAKPTTVSANKSKIHVSF